MRNRISAGHLSDAELIAASRNDASAFSALFERHFGSIYRFACRRLGPDLGEEVAADTFAVAFARLAAFNPDAATALPWLYGIASNEIRNHRRAERRRYRLLAKIERQPELWVAADHGEEIAGDMATAAVLAEALSRLRVDDLEALLLFVWAELSQKEIAQLQGVAHATVRSRIHRARQLLREHLVRSGQEIDEHGV